MIRPAPTAPAAPPAEMQQAQPHAQSGRDPGRAGYLHQQRTLILVETLLMLLVVALTALVIVHPGPLPGDVGSTLTLQRLLLPHAQLTWLINLTSELTWPLLATLTTIAIVMLFVLWRRWLDALLIVVIPALGSGVSYLTALIVQRPRPVGYGIHIQLLVHGYWSFPSGHVEHAVVFFGLLFFLTYLISRPDWWVWALRPLLLTIVVLMGPSRMLEGEHWLSDVMAGYLCGTFWLLIGLQAYGWAAQHWPRLLAPGERSVIMLARTGAVAPHARQQVISRASSQARGGKTG